MGRRDELARINPLLHRPGRLEMKAERANQLGGEPSAFRETATQLRQVHRLGRAKILYSIKVVKSQGNEGQQQQDKPLKPNSTLTFFKAVDEFLNALGRFVVLHVSGHWTTTPPA